jgi:hypothetical protein
VLNICPVPSLPVAALSRAAGGKRKHENWLYRGVRVRVCVYAWPIDGRRRRRLRILVVSQIIITTIVNSSPLV